MKRKSIMICAAVCAVLMTFAGCGNEKTSSESSSSASSSAETSEQTTESTEAEKTDSSEAADTTEAASGIEEATETPSSQKTESESESSAGSAAESPAAASDEPSAAPAADTDLLSISEAKEIIGAINTIDRIGASALSWDSSQEYTDANGETYFKVTDPQFSTVADVKNYLDTYLTQSLIGERYSEILGTECPRCIDVDGALYMLASPRGGGFAFSDADPVIEKTSENGYSILAEYDNFGTTDCMDINVVEEGGRWKISNIVFGY